MEEEGKHQTSSLLPLLPPHRSEGLVEPWHCPSSPLAPRSWGVCCSQRAAQKRESRRETLDCKNSTETALQWEPNRAWMEVWGSLRWGEGSGTGRIPANSCGVATGPSLHPQEGPSSGVIEGIGGRTSDMLKGMKNYRQSSLRGDSLAQAPLWCLRLICNMISIQIILCFSASSFLNIPLKTSFQSLGRKY